MRLKGFLKTKAYLSRKTALDIFVQTNVDYTNICPASLIYLEQQLQYKSENRKKIKMKYCLNTKFKGHACEALLVWGDGLNTSETQSRVCLLFKYILEGKSIPSTITSIIQTVLSLEKP